MQDQAIQIISGHTRDNKTQHIVSIMAFDEIFYCQGIPTHQPNILVKTFNVKKLFFYQL